MIYTEFDPLEEVRFGVSFDRNPTVNRRGLYQVVGIDDWQEHRFPHFNVEDMTAVTFGMYQIHNNRKYVTDILISSDSQQYLSLDCLTSR